MKAQMDRPFWDHLQSAAAQLKRAGDLDYVAMSVAAKTCYLLRENNGQASREELRSLAPRFGWQVTTHQLDNAAVYLDRLGLVKLTPD
jgi:hypothetical protein